MKNSDQKYATLKFKKLASALLFKERVGSKFTVKEKEPGVFSVRFKINIHVPKNPNYHKNREKYK